LYGSKIIPADYLDHVTVHKPFKMPPHALSLACSARTTSLRSCSSFIGSRSANESSSSRPCWFSRRCTVCCRRISRMTVSCSPIPGAVNSDRLTLRLVLSCGLTRLSAIVASLWLDREDGQFTYQIATTSLRPQP